MKERGNQVAKVFQQQKLRTLKKLNKTIKKFRPSLKGKGGGRERETIQNNDNSNPGVLFK